MNMKKIMLVAFVVALILVASIVAINANAQGGAGEAVAKDQGKSVDAAKGAKPQVQCPVMKGKIDRKFYADYKGKRIYFCCAGCIKAFNKNPEKYMKNLKGVKLEKAPKPQVVCPVMNGKIDKKYYTDYKGKRIYFCCPNCIGEFKKNPGKYMKKLQGVQLENVPSKKK